MTPASICSVSSVRILTSGRRERTDTQKLKAGAKGSEEKEHPGHGEEAAQTPDAW